jgi:hypothetical protein
MLRIGVVTGSTRPGRHNEEVARWVFDLATERTDAEFELVDIATYNLPLLDKPLPPSLMLSLFTDFENFPAFNPGPLHEKEVDAMLDQVIAWGHALKALRAKSTGAN